VEVGGLMADGLGWGEGVEGCDLGDVLFFGVWRMGW
jgi:hypothetical protein